MFIQLLNVQIKKSNFFHNILTTNSSFSILTKTLHLFNQHGRLLIRNCGIGFFKKNKYTFTAVLTYLKTATMNKKMIGLVSAVLMIAGAFLPWAKVEFLGISKSMNGFMGEMGGNPGALIVLLGALSALFIYLGKKWSNIVAIIFGLLGTLWALKQMNDVKDMGEMVSIGIGIYLIMIAGIGVAVGGIMAMRGDKPTA